MARGAFLLTSRCVVVRPIAMREFDIDAFITELDEPRYVGEASTLAQGKPHPMTAEDETQQTSPSSLAHGQICYLQQPDSCSAAKPTPLFDHLVAHLVTCSALL